MTFIHFYVSFTANFTIGIRDDHIADLTAKTIVVYNSFITNFTLWTIVNLELWNQVLTVIDISLWHALHLKQ